ncbi:uncharacterized protein LOC126973393 [Leptidea sinapis]|uniref:uncharacterized protein LOC126973393 n=1 Tax=Leptidea sinapis TaxID=189913 RepID=UPI0021C2DCB9|nr:uncharacterized protein LOC126973393 [Leptidea sinapis]
MSAKSLRQNCTYKWLIIWKVFFKSVICLKFRPLNKVFFDFQDQDNSTSILSSTDRNYINAHYFNECGTYSVRVSQRRSADVTTKLTTENFEYYKDKVWPLGIVLYGLQDELLKGGTPDHNLLSYAMTTIELLTCVVFHEIKNEDVLVTKNYVWFTSDGEDTPYFGFQEGKQILKLSSITNGAPGHKAHVINNLMRILGVHMMSNRFDRDNYISINWERVQNGFVNKKISSYNNDNNMFSGKEHLLEKAPEQSWLSSIPYDFQSATHAPANFICSSCELGASTVQPIQVNQ